MSMKDSTTTTSKYCIEKGGGLLDSTLTPTSSACSIAAEEYIEDCNDALARLSATEISSTVSSASESDIGSMKEQHKILKARHRSQSIDLKKQKELTEDQEKIVEKQKNMLLGILNACEYICLWYLLGVASNKYDMCTRYAHISHFGCDIVELTS